MQVWGARDKASTDTLVRATLDLLRAEYELRWQHYPPPLLGVGPAAEERGPSTKGQQAHEVKQG